MNEIWTSRAAGWSDSRDMVGYNVHATDGDIGKIDEATTQADRSHIVVDTGFWIFGKKRLIPAGAVARVDHDDETVHVNMTKDQIKDAPDFDDTRRAEDQDSYYRTHQDYYDPYIFGGPMI